MLGCLHLPSHEDPNACRAYIGHYFRQLQPVYDDEASTDEDVGDIGEADEAMSQNSDEENQQGDRQESSSDRGKLATLSLQQMVTMSEDSPRSEAMLWA